MEEEEGQIAADAAPSNEMLDEFNTLKQGYIDCENKGGKSNNSISQAIKEI